MNKLKFFKKIINHLDPGRKRDLIIVFIFSFLSSIAESISLAILIPFISFFLDPNSYLFGSFFSSSFTFLNISSEKEILTFVSFFFVIIVLISCYVKLRYIKKSNKLIEDITSDFRIKIFNFLLSQDYSYYFKHGSNEIMSNLSQKTNAFSTIIFATINILNSFLICLAIVIILLINDPLFTPAIVAFVTAFFLIIYKLKSKDVSAKGQKINLNQNYIINIFENAVGYLQEIIIYDLKRMFSNSLAKASKTTASSISNIRSTAMQPKIYLETFFIILAIFFIYFSNLTAVSIQSNLAFLAILAYGIQRTLPQINNIYNLSINFKSVKPTIISFLKILDSDGQKIDLEENITLDKIRFQKEITLKDVSYKYEEKNNKVLENINLKINKGDKIAIKGKTGSGKTTLINIMTGLLTPLSGNLFVDEIEINEENKKNWQKNIALVPQNVFLNDCSILENIMLGYDLSQKNEEKLKTILKDCELENFINKLPNKLNEKVGERGVRISGGQKQRIGIARALYRDSDIIILDEPTNALDFKMETKILNSLLANRKRKTIIVIMHSENSLKQFDQIINLDDINKKNNGDSK